MGPGAAVRRRGIHTKGLVFQQLCRFPEIWHNSVMKTTLVINDDLYRRIKAKAALEGRTVTELVEDGLRLALGMGTTEQGLSAGSRRLQLPLIRAGSKPSRLFEGMSQDEIHQRLADLQSEADATSV